MKHFHLVLALLLSFCALTAGGTAGSAAGPAPSAEVSFSAETAAVCAGQPAVVEIGIKEVTALFGYQFEVKISDPNVAQLSAAFVNTWFNTSADASVPAGWEASCSNGLCKFAVAKLKNKNVNPLSGSGAVARIEITRKGSSGPGGVIALALQNVKLVNASVVEIPFVRGKDLQIKSCGYVNLDLKVRYQGRGEPGSAGLVTLRDPAGVFPPLALPYDKQTGKAAAAVPVWPGAEGSPYAVEIEGKDGYFTTLLKGVVLKEGAANTVERILFGGDADGSGAVEVADLACVAGAFGGAAAPCGATGKTDLTLDGMVDVLDLVLVSSNLGLAGVVEVDPEVTLPPTRKPTTAIVPPTATLAEVPPSATVAAPTLAPTASLVPVSTSAQSKALPTRTPTAKVAKPTATATPKR